MNDDISLLQLIEVHHHTVHNNALQMVLLLLLTLVEVVNFLEEELVNAGAVNDMTAGHILSFDIGLNLGLFLDHIHGSAYKHHSSNSLDTLSIDTVHYIVYNV